MLRKTRAFVLQLMAELSLEQVNTIPEGFSNNISWNFGHMIAAQQGVCYKRAGLPIVVEEAFFEAYKPGSRPEQAISQEQWEAIKALSATSIDRLEADYASGLFSSYTPWTTRYGVELQSIEDAMQFILYHEGLHAGFIMALKKAVVLQPA